MVSGGDHFSSHAWQQSRLGVLFLSLAIVMHDSENF